MASGVATTSRSSVRAYCRRHGVARGSSNAHLGTEVSGHLPRLLPMTCGLHRVTMDFAVGRYYDPTTGQFLCVDPDVRDSGVGYAYADDNPVSDSDPTGQAARFINPYGCGVYVGNAHWQNGQRATNTVKVNASILNCREEPEWGIITVILWKVGFLDEDNHNEEMTTVTSTESAFHYQKPSAGGWQMSNQKTLIKGRRVDGVSSTFFGQVVYAAVVEGGIKYDTSDVERPIRSAANWTADDFWTGK